MSGHVVKKSRYVWIFRFCIVSAVIIGLVLVNKKFHVKSYSVLKESQETNNGKVYDEDSSKWYLILVNKTHKLPDDYQIKLANLKNGFQVDERILGDLQTMFDKAREQGINPYINSAYRTYQDQQDQMNQKINTYESNGYTASEAKKAAAATVAKPGTSEHELGLAVDIISSDGYDYNQSVYDWLARNAYKYGFILRYPEDKEDITGISYEPWHYRYVGISAAKQIWEQKLTLEEYLKEY